MKVRNQGVLVSNQQTRTLGYADSKPQKDSCAGVVIALAVSAVSWPLFLLMGTLTIPMFSVQYCKARWNQYKIINILSDDAKLTKYAQKRIEICNRQIENLKSDAIFLMGTKLTAPAAVGLDIPQKQGLLETTSARLSKERWANFDWDQFRNKNFSEMLNGEGTPDKDVLQKLEIVRAKINCISQQKVFLEKSPGDANIIKNIAKLSFVKNAFQRERSKQWLFFMIHSLVPTGIFFSSYLYMNPRRDDRSTYQGKKGFFPAGNEWNEYDDLIDAHNKLVSQNDYLVPYIV